MNAAIGARRACVREEDIMREAMIGISIFMCVVMAAIMAMPAAAWFRRRRRRRSLLACFLHALEDGAIPRLTYIRERKCFGDGWIDTCRGSAGTMPFTFSVTIEPWARLKTYRLHLVGEDWAVETDPARDPLEPFIRVHATLLSLLERQESRHLPEAS